MTGFTQRLLKRETHSSRAPLSVAAAILVSLLAVYCLLEALLRAIGQPEWLVDPLTAADRLSRLPAGIPAVLLGSIGVLAFLLGLVFLAHAVLPGRRARHVMADPRVVVVVDDEVIASALARCARVAAGVTREQVVVVVSAASVQVNVRPTSGIGIDGGRIQAAVDSEVAAMGLEPVPAVVVHLASTGVIGV